MSRITRMVARMGFAAAIVGGLAFGATQALARGANGDDCQPCPYPDLNKECETCCIEVLHFEGGDCMPLGDCLCY